MRPVHIECSPDELLIKKLGFTRKFITHHQGKSRIFTTLNKNQNHLALADEDPGSVKTRYEESLHLKEETEGIKYFTDKPGNEIYFLNGKLEDWIISICKKQNISLSEFGLPDNPEDLHDIINHRLPEFATLLDELIKVKNPSILKLKSWLTKK